MIRNQGFEDVGVKFGDVGCVHVPLAINAKPFSTHSDRSIKSSWNRPEILVVRVTVVSFIHLRELVELPSSLPPARVEGGL